MIIGSRLRAAKTRCMYGRETLVAVSDIKQPQRSSASSQEGAAVGELEKRFR